MQGGAKKSKKQWRSEARGSPQVRRALLRLGERIRELRLARGITQEKAASLAQLDPKHWQAIEAGTTNTTMASLVGMSRALKVKLSELFEGV